MSYYLFFMTNQVYGTTSSDQIRRMMTCLRGSNELNFDNLVPENEAREKILIVQKGNYILT